MYAAIFLDVITFLISFHFINVNVTEVRVLTNYTLILLPSGSSPSGKATRGPVAVCQLIIHRFYYPAVVVPAERLQGVVCERIIH